MNFINFSCISFTVLGQKVLIAPDQNVSQGGKCPNTTNFYTTISYIP